MLLSINDRMTLDEVRDKFEECFPGLTLCFYSKNHTATQPSDEKDRYPEFLRIGDIRKIHGHDIYEIKSWYTAAQVETDLAHKYGLFSQVCRYDADHNPVQSTYTDGLTLSEQSRLSKARQIPHST